MQYADPELLIHDWLANELGNKIRVYADPGLPPNWAFTAPLVHLQRGASGGLALSLDDVTLDVDVYSKVADHARAVAQQVWAAMTLPGRLPLTTFQPSGILVKASVVTMPPRWTPDPSVRRRSASYRVILHGFPP